MSCPECSVPRIANHPAGFLVYSHDQTCGIGNAEDGTRANDHEQVTKLTVYGTLPHLSFARATTQAENMLLAELGYLPSLATFVAVAARTISALTALPAFFVGGVPTLVVVLVSVFIAATIVSVVLMLAPGAAGARVA